jgi:hypothetical protein
MIYSTTAISLGLIPAEVELSAEEQDVNGIVANAVKTRVQRQPRNTGTARR